jgi:5-methylcytosine-specific restriction endonuclease McrA/uncharacterized C2H2 Zn-finger protein
MPTATFKAAKPHISVRSATPETAGARTPTALLGIRSMRQQTLTEVESDGEQCPTCGRTGFKSEQGVRQHHTKAHGERLGYETLFCDHCGGSYESRKDRSHNSRFCDEDCMYAYRTGEQHHNYNSVTKPCSQCGDNITKNESHIGEIGPFCDHECYGEWLSENNSGSDHWQYEKEETECEWCGSELWRKPHQFDGRDHFCDYDCLTNAKRENSTPRSLVDAVRRHLSEESWSAVAREHREKHNGQCDWCGEYSDGRNHDVHHIVPVAYGGTNDDALLMGLCRECHMKAERYTKTIPEIEAVLTE